jgi:hypothetical protein
VAVKRKETLRETPVKERRRFLVLNGAALLAAATGGLWRALGLPRSRPFLPGREARFYRRIDRRKTK